MIDRISIVIHLRLFLDDYNFGARLSGLLEEIVPQTILPSKRGLTVKYKSRLVHLEDIDQPQDDQPQADAPVYIEELTEELKDDLEELTDDPLIEPEKINPLKRTYQDAWPKLAQL